MGGTSRGAVAGLRLAYTSGTVAGLTDAQLLERFVGRRDDGTSFEALLTRHGPMVLGVCRSLLRDEHAADDAFQATFLILVRRAGSVRAGDSLGRWLYGVARKVAVRSRSDAAKLRSRERATTTDAAEPHERDLEDVERGDLREAIHDELSRLSANHRAAIVLCHLEGLSHEEAARRLGWPVGTVRSRLARGRDRLRVGLSRRGFAGAAPLTGLSPAMVPERLILAIKPAAARLVAGEALAAGMVPASVLTLTTGVLHAMTFTKMMTVAGLLAATTLIGVGGAAVHAYQDSGKPAPIEKPAQVDSKKTAAAEKPKPAPVPVPVGDPDQEAERRRLSARMQARYTGSIVQRGPLAEGLPEGPNLTPSQVLGAKLEQARSVVARDKQLRAQMMIGESAVDTARSELAIVQGQIAGRIDDLEDELEYLQARLSSRKAELQRAIAQAELSQTVVTRNDRLNTRIRGTVADEDLVKGRAEKQIADAERGIKEAGVQEFEVLIKQTTRQLERFRNLLKPAKEKPAGN